MGYKMGSNLVILVGPTAVGKTEVCIKLAKKLNSDVFSCDSRQLYQEMSIGTAKPTQQEMSGVVHHFVDSHSVKELYSAGDYERDAEILLRSYFNKKEVAIMSGGTGLFVKAITHGLDNMPSAPLALRKNLMERLEKEGLEILKEELKIIDPQALEDIDNQNSQRIVRALEVCLSTGQPFSSFKNKSIKAPQFNFIKIGLERPREELYNRINLRVDKMLEMGLVEEVKSLQKFEKTNALQTVGYKEVFSFINEEYTYETMVELLKRNTRRYAKRQLTWFKNQDDFKWFQAEDYKGIEEYVLHSLNCTKL